MSMLVAASLLLLGGQKPKTTLAGSAKPRTERVRMAGDDGLVGTPYRVGERGSELDFTLETAEFTLRAPMAEGTILAKRDRKILLLTFSVANPQMNEQNFVYSSFRFTAVAPDGESSEYDGYFYHPDCKTRFDTTLKPGGGRGRSSPFPFTERGR